MNHEAVLRAGNAVVNSLRNGTVAVCAGLLLLAGCDVGQPDVISQGSSLIAVTGDTDAGFAARAVFELRVEPEIGPVFVISVQDPARAEQVVVLAGRGVPVGESYVIDDEESAVGYILLDEGGDRVAYFVDSGQFTLTHAGPEQLSGAFELNASRFLDPTVTINVEGTFEAAPGELEVAE